jgi:beta-lactamase class A
MFKAKIPAYLLAVSILATGAIVYILARRLATTDRQSDRQVVKVAPCNIQRKRLSGYSFVKPLIYADWECESQELLPIKENIINTLNLAKNEGLVSSASVYIRSFSKSLWTSVNSEDKYHPASLAKVPVLITYLHMVESNNHILDEQIKFMRPDSTLPQEHYTSKTIHPGRSYAVKDLLHYMIAFSDNNATILLMQHMNLDMYNKAFTDLGLDRPSFNFDDFLLSAKEYSLFMRVLYNASYLSVPASEYALEMLADCDFKDGLIKQLPANIKVAHKFGEAGYNTTYELHESGIVYAGEHPYILTIMTKGTDLKKQATVISNISAQVYSTMANSAF